MNDFDYDCLQKKRIARQSKYRKNGSRSRKCTISTDYMTQRAWRERNGKVLEINLNQPVSWSIFKELSKSVQEQYIRTLIETYCVNAASLAEMFDVRPQTVRRFIESNGLDIRFRVGHSMNAQQKANWRMFIVSGADGKAEHPAMDNKQLSQEQDCIQRCSQDMSMKKVSLGFDGKIDVQAIANSLYCILGRDSEGSIEIICNLY